MGRDGEEPERREELDVLLRRIAEEYQETARWTGRGEMNPRLKEALIAVHREAHGLVADEIKQWVVEQGLKKGDRLPGEAGLKLLWEPKIPRTSYLVIEMGNGPDTWKRYIEIEVGQSVL